MSTVALDLPEGFVVLDAADPGLAQVLPGADDPALQAWLGEVADSRASSGAVLVAVQLERDGEQVVAVSLVVHLHPLDAAEPLEVAVQGLRAMALARTSPQGEVSVLELPAGPAVATAEVVDVDGRGAAALVAVQLPLPAAGQLLTLTMSTPATSRLAACAAAAAVIACRVRLEDPHPSA